MNRYLMNTLGLIIGLTLLFSLPLVHAEKPADRAALEGVNAGKVVWDINMGDPSKLSLYLRVIQETYADLVRQGVEPDMIFAFRGRSVLLISTLCVSHSVIDNLYRAFKPHRLAPALPMKTEGERREKTGYINLSDS